MKAGMRSEVHHPKKRRISIPKGSDPCRHAAPEPGVQFALMQWGCMNSKRELGPQYLWEPETSYEKKSCEAQLKERNEKAVEKVNQKRKNAMIEGTVEFQELKVSL